MLTARTKTIEKTGTGRQFPPSLASLLATKFSLQIYMELTDDECHGSHIGVTSLVGASVAHLSELAPFTSANVGSIPVGNDL